ncbi:hypothetical protein Ancab_033333 [Ancistrocladus abbreviatus]
MLANWSEETRPCCRFTHFHSLTPLKSRVISMTPIAVRMKASILEIMIFALITSQPKLASALQSTVPAFMWSPHLDNCNLWTLLELHLLRKDLWTSSSLQIERFLAEASSGNRSVNSTVCDRVCQIKTSLLEGILAGIVLLVILISGLCCMMGIDTPTRFETNQDSS